MYDFKIDLKKYPSVMLIEAALKANHRFASGSIDRCIELFGETWVSELEEVISPMFAGQNDLFAAVKGYAIFAMQSMRLQAVFDRELKYNAKTHSQVSSEVYFNEHHMMKEYLPGLLLSHFLWPHHYRQLQFFENAFIKTMMISGAESFLEVGVGTGLYSSLVLRKLPNVNGLGLDISPSSKRFTEEMMKALGVADRYRVELNDVTISEVEEKAKWLICVEVLEHLDDPVSFLRALRRNLVPGGRAFITAALNAAHSDHIYLYRNANEVLSQIAEVGFNLEQFFVGTAYKPTSSGVPVPEAAAFVVY